MNSEKVKEIKECLQSCNDDKMACYDCKYYEKCEKILTKNNILTLINELEKEVEDRKAEVLHLQEYGKKLIRETELKQFAEKLKEKALSHCRTINCYELTFIETTIDELLKEYENDTI